MVMTVSSMKLNLWSRLVLLKGWKYVNLMMIFPSGLIDL